MAMTTNSSIKVNAERGRLFPGWSSLSALRPKRADPFYMKRSLSQAEKQGGALVMETVCELTPLLEVGVPGTVCQLAGSSAVEDCKITPGASGQLSTTFCPDTRSLENGRRFDHVEHEIIEVRRGGSAGVLGKLDADLHRNPANSGTW
jgi:hypothetical protein